MRSSRSHQRVYALLAPTFLALAVPLDCSVDRSGLGAGAETTPVTVGAGGSVAGTGGSAAGTAGAAGRGGGGGSSGTSGGNAGSGGTAARGDGAGSGGGSAA